MSRLLHEKKFNCGTFRVYQDKPDFDLTHIHQVHSNLIKEYVGYDLSEEQIDGILVVKDKAGINLAIKTADCLPVLLIGEKIAMIHAGWKGLASNILTQDNLKNINFTQAYIGPSIYHYEVQNDFRENFPNSEFFYEKAGKYYFNLQGEAQKQLENAYPGIKVYQSDICTFTQADYNSYRRDKTTRRNWNIFTLN